jgi:ABC-type multidrug transport system fused ATPase/permease subunit
MKQNNMKQFFLSNIQPALKMRYFVVPLMMLSTAVGLFQPFLLGKIVDSLSGDSIPYTLLILSVTVIILGFFLNWAQNYWWFNMIFKGNALARRAMMSEILKNDISFFREKAKGDIINTVVSDAASYAELLLVSMPMILCNSILIIIVFIFLFYMNVLLAFVVLASCFLYFIYYKFLNGKLRFFFKKEREGYSDILTSAQETLDGVETIQLYKSESYFANKFGENLWNHFRSIAGLQNWKSMGQSGNSTITEGLPVLIVAISSYLLLRGNITIGVIFSYCTYLPYLFEPIINFTDLNLSFQQAKVLEERLETMLHTDHPLPSDQAAEVGSIDKIEFDAINFSYDEKEIIQQFSLTLQKGDSIAITGPSGIGKSTLIRLLLRQLLPTEGEIKINDQNLQNIDIYSYRDHVAVLPQDVFIFDGTMEENIKMGRVSEKKRLQDVIVKSALERVSSIEAKNYSGGEKQRVGMARMLLGNADVLIMDEPTSALDMATESELIRNLKEVIRDREHIIIIITHRESLLELSDYELCLKGSGSYEIHKSK